jgi:hypothetical protein
MYRQTPVADAVREHFGTIALLRVVCSAEIATNPAEYNDDLFLVRFCISHKGNGDAAANALRTAIKFRNQNKDLLAVLRTGAKHPDEVAMTARRAAAACW